MALGYVYELIAVAAAVALAAARGLASRICALVV